MGSPLVDVIRSASMGSLSVSQEMAEEIAAKLVQSCLDDKLDLLTDREMEIVNLYRLGYTSVRVAEILFIERRTVESHVRNVYNKIGVDTRNDLIDLLVAREICGMPVGQGSRDVLEKAARLKESRR